MKQHIVSLLPEAALCWLRGLLRIFSGVCENIVLDLNIKSAEKVTIKIKFPKTCGIFANHPLKKCFLVVFMQQGNLGINP